MSHGGELLLGLALFVSVLNIIGADESWTSSSESRESGDRHLGDLMSRIACPSSERLFAFALGELPETDLDEVAKHLDACTRCDEQAGRLDGAGDTVLAGLKLLRDPGLRILIADQERSSETGDVPTPTETWGDFRIIREIGRGGMGIVYEAYQGSLNRHVALKFLPENGDRARFLREAKAAGRLHHTHIVPVFGIGEQGGRHYYVMQFIDGQGLDDRLRRRRRAAAEGPCQEAAAGPDYREAARIGVQVSEALAYAHEQGVIHRDIKPSNLLIDAAGNLWITDFGLAKDAGDEATLTHTGDLLGTLRYMAPERIGGRGDARADIYGLGATLFELICGRPAFDETDRAALLHQLLHRVPPRPRQLDPRVPRDLETIVLKAMAREPAHRYTTAAELAEDLRRFLEDRPIRRGALRARAGVAVVPTESGDGGTNGGSLRPSGGDGRGRLVRLCADHAGPGRRGRPEGGGPGGEISGD